MDSLQYELLGRKKKYKENKMHLNHWIYNETDFTISARNCRFNLKTAHGVEQTNMFISGSLSYMNLQYFKAQAIFLFLQSFFQPIYPIFYLLTMK